MVTTNLCIDTGVLMCDPWFDDCGEYVLSFSICGVFNGLRNF